MIIRDFTNKDKIVFIEMCKVFYSGGAVLHEVKEECFSNTFDEIIKGTPYARGIMFEHDDEIAGYMLMSFTHSNEVGGLVVLLEELYILPEFQGRGFGKQVFEFVFNEYADRAKRYRLEVNKENVDAVRLYKLLGFTELEYDQYIIEV